MRLQAHIPAAIFLAVSGGAFATEIEQPSYVNYDISHTSSMVRTSVADAMGPTYVNYQFESVAQDIDTLIRSNPTAAGDSSGFWIKTGHVNDYGVYEPIYIDYDLSK